jgi:hypothetical protein
MVKTRFWSYRRRITSYQIWSSGHSCYGTIVQSGSCPLSRPDRSHHDFGILLISQLINDAILVPMDTVKQKRQLNLKNYTGTIDCLKTVIRTEGMHRSLPFPVQRRAFLKTRFLLSQAVVLFMQDIGQPF